MSEDHVSRIIYHWRVHAVTVLIIKLSFRSRSEVNHLVVQAACWLTRVLGLFDGALQKIICHFDAI
jgi:hypothetical protein